MITLDQLDALQELRSIVEDGIASPSDRTYPRIEAQIARCVALGVTRKQAAAIADEVIRGKITGRTAVAA